FARTSFGGSIGDVPCRDCEVRNNIIVLGSASPRPMLFMAAGAHVGTLTMSNNRYHKQGGSAVFWWEPTGSYNLDLAGWKTVSGTDTNSTEGDPQVDATWHLAAGSPCIDAGATIAGFTDDYDGNTRTGTSDIGADETGGTALPTPPPAGTLGTGAGGSTTPPPPADHDKPAKEGGGGGCSALPENWASLVMALAMGVALLARLTQRSSRPESSRTSAASASAPTPPAPPAL